MTVEINLSNFYDYFWPGRVNLAALADYMIDISFEQAIDVANDLTIDTRAIGHLWVIEKAFLTLTA